jgi:hypothetical protein
LDADADALGAATLADFFALVVCVFAAAGILCNEVLARVLRLRGCFFFFFLLLALLMRCGYDTRRRGWVSVPRQGWRA